ncbi:MAG: hypothetical protein ACE5HI_07460 [bacterium]
MPGLIQPLMDIATWIVGVFGILAIVCLVIFLLLENDRQIQSLKRDAQVRDEISRKNDLADEILDDMSLSDRDALLDRLRSRSNKRDQGRD